jgi:CelD/BcsL family acetyltransferase involved in cellulose biosynthesis
VSERRGGSISRVRAIDLERITEDDLAAWESLRAERDSFRAPFFAPSFAEAVHATSSPVLVVLGEDALGSTRLVWPVQRVGWTLRHAGWPAADFQGPVTTASFDPRAVLTATDARVVSFDHLVGDCQELAGAATAWQLSPYLDVTGGLPGYLERASKSGRSNMAQARRRIRKAEERHGELRFTPASDDPALLDEVIALKRRQYAASGARDFFRNADHVRLLRRLLRRQGPDVYGVLSALHFGDRLVAAHFGLRSGDRLHWWFPVYDPADADLAPGWMLLRELVAASGELGVSRIDLGRGTDEYKRRAMTGQVLVGEGVVAVSGLVDLRVTVAHRARSALASAGVAPRARKLVRRVRHPDVPRLVSAGRPWS